MAEIIIAIILHLSTLVGGVPSDQEKSDKEKTEDKNKTETPIKANGGSGNWQDGGK